MKHARKLLSDFLVIAMIAGFFTALPLTAAAQSSGANIDLTDHATPSGDGWTYSGGPAGVFIIHDGASVTVTGAVSDGTCIYVEPDAIAAITLNNATVSIPGLPASPPQRSPIVLDSGATLNLTITGTNTLTAVIGGAGIEAPSGTLLSIDGSGVLTAIGGGGTANGAGGAGIGGGAFSPAGAITISAGTVNAVGGDGNGDGGGGAGIGGGGHNTWNGGAGGAITITGGIITAAGGDGSGGGAGIGGGGSDYAGGAGGSVSITGGIVTAYGGSGTGGAGGANIGGGGTYGSGSTVAGAPSLYLITASASTGGSISPSGTLGVAPGGDQAYTVTPDSGYIIASVTDNGTDVTSRVTGGTYTATDIAADHVVAATFIMPGDCGLIFDASGDPVTGGKFWLDINNDQSAGAGDIEYTPPAGAADWNSAANTLTLTDFSWITPAKSALTIRGAATIELNGTSTVKSTCTANPSYGLYAPDDLTVTGAGTLNITGGNAVTTSFGIGADSNITINGGVVIVKGGDNTSFSYGVYAAGNITVNGGALIAAGGNNNAYAWGLVTGFGGAITINAGTVEASGASSAFSQAPGALPADYDWATSDNPDGSNPTSGAFPGTAYTYSESDKYVKIIHIEIAPSVSPATLNITTGRQGTVTISLGHGAVAAASAAITSLNPGVATVSPGSVTADSAITVTGVSAGSATITITWAGGTPVAAPASVQVNVTDVAPATHTITLNQQTGGTATVSAANAAKDTPVTLGISSTQPYYSFDRWNIAPGVTFTSGSVLTADATFSMPDTDVTITPVYSYDTTGDGGTSPALTVTVKGATNADVNPAPWENPFTDVNSSDWFFGDMQFACENGLMLGTSTDPMLFSPNINTSRAMIVTTLWRLAGSPDDMIPAAAGGGQFTDVMEGTYYYQAVNWAVSNGIISGYGNGEFGPDDNVTREQLAAILYRYAVFEGKGPQGAWAIWLNFTDASDISDWAIDGMMFCYMNGIISGYPDGSVKPRGESTRAEVASMLHRFLELSK